MKFSLPVEHKRVDSVTAIFETPEKGDRDSAFLLAHGAGSGMEHPWLGRIAAGLLELGFPVLRFNYGYRERMEREGKRFPPDRAPVLEAVHELARAELEKRLPNKRLILAGKSMGGRMSSHLAAFEARCGGLCFFGYPLHPAGKPERLRDEHFATICQPALFLQGTRDALCDLELLQRSLTKYGGKATLHVEEDADHSFHVRKSSGRDDDQVLASLLGRIDRWERDTFPPA